MAGTRSRAIPGRVRNCDLPKRTSRLQAVGETGHAGSSSRGQPAGDKKTTTPNNIEDEQLLAAVASRSPAMQAQYASNLENVNAYIKDAEESAQANPNDEEAQQIVMDAYEQRATIYEMALDRSLP